MDISPIASRVVDLGSMGRTLHHLEMLQDMDVICYCGNHMEQQLSSGGRDLPGT